MELIYGTRDKSIVVDDNELERLIEHDKDFDYSNDYYCELYCKYRIELPVVKNRELVTIRIP